MVIFQALIYDLHLAYSSNPASADFHLIIPNTLSSSVNVLSAIDSYPIELEEIA